MTQPKPMIAALRGQGGRERRQRPPFWLMRQAGRFLPEYRAVRAQAGRFLDLCYTPSLAAEVTLQPLRRFGMDAAILFSDILVVPHALGQPLDYVEGEGPKLDPIRGRDDLGRLSLEGLHRTLAPVYETVARVRAGLPAGAALIGFAGAPWTVACYMVEGGGSSDFARTKRFAYGDPEGFQELVDLLVTATTEYLLHQIAAGAEVVQLFDSWAGILPDDAFERWVVTPTARIAARLKAEAPDVPVIGFPRAAGLLYGRYAAAAGIDALGLDTTVPLESAAALQARIAVQGNLDPVLLLAGGDALRRRVTATLDALASRPFVFNLGHGVLPATPVEHVAALAEQVRAWAPA